MKPYYLDAARRVVLYHGDSREVLHHVRPALAGKVNLLLTDPPYGMAYQGRGQSTGKANVKGDGARQGMRLVRQVMAEAVELLCPDAHVYSFCHWESLPDFYDSLGVYMDTRGCIVWDKGEGVGGTGDCEYDYKRTWEAILYGVRGRGQPLTGGRIGSVWKVPGVHHSKRIHPTEKPPELLQRMVEKSCPSGGWVLDPFAGSCATAVAAIQSGRRALCVEFEERYCEQAAKRLEALAASTP